MSSWTEKNFWINISTKQHNTWSRKVPFVPIYCYYCRNPLMEMRVRIIFYCHSILTFLWLYKQGFFSQRCHSKIEWINGQMKWNVIKTLKFQSYSLLPLQLSPSFTCIYIMYYTYDEKQIKLNDLWSWPHEKEGGLKRKWSESREMKETRLQIYNFGILSINEYRRTVYHVLESIVWN